MIPGHLDPTKLTPSKKKSGLVRTGEDEADTKVARLKSGMENVDRVFGGEEDPGIPRGMVIQLAGNPGVGKSTLLGQIAGGPLRDCCLYVAAEEKASRIWSRARRVRAQNPNIQIVETCDLGEAKKAIAEVKPKLVIVDSLQGMRLNSSGGLNGIEEGEDGQIKFAKHTQDTVRDVAFSFINEAHKHNCALILVGHMNKEEMMAGLKTIEHMVDVVAFFKGDANKPHRSLSCSKNREGDTFYKAWFKMTKIGLMEAKEPTKAELEEESQESQQPQNTEAKA